MSAATPAGRVIEFLRQFRRQTSVDTSVILTVWTDPRAEGAELRPDDLDTVIAQLADAHGALEILKRERSLTRASDILFNTADIDRAISLLEGPK